MLHALDDPGPCAPRDLRLCSHAQVAGWVCHRASWTKLGAVTGFFVQLFVLEGLSQICSCFGIICGMYCTGSLSHNASLTGLLFWSGGASLAVPRPMGVIFVVLFLIQLQPSSLPIFCWGRTLRVQDRARTFLERLK